VTGLISGTFEVLSVTVWLVEENQDRLAFGSSTFLSDIRADRIAETLGSIEVLLRDLRGVDGPVDLDRSTEAWAEQVCTFTPMKFPGKGGDRIAVPLKARDELVGLITLADRVQGVPYSVEELELLGTIAEQVAAQLLNFRLSERLVHAKQFEAFQAMSAFFVHDLKNTASTLSLMLQNLPKHFEDPVFREDALKAMSRSVGKINDLINRLSLLRQKPEVKPVKGDLNALADSSLRGMASPDLRPITTQFGNIPPVNMDANQIQRVITNLLLNARDAAGPDGEIRVETSATDASAVLAVTDNGCGMTPEYVRRSLFRPFQTTKKQGLGIGLFQSKMIVEAHQGRIEVQSMEGKGSTFRVCLPLSGQAVASSQ